MKKNFKIGSLILLGMVANTTIDQLPSQAAEVDKPLNYSSTGTVEFLEDDGDDIVVDPVDPTDPNNPISDPKVNPDKGPLKVVAITPLDFGVHSITPASSGEWNYLAKSATIKYKDGSTKKVANFVQYKDTRADGNENKHTLSAKASPFTNSTGKILKAATLNFDNIQLSNIADQSMVSEKSFDSNKELATDGTSTVFVSQTEAGKGFGQFVLSFGDSNQADSSVKLTIPSSGNKLVANSVYTSTITWTISDAR